MKIYEISILGKNILRKNLSYFSSQKLEKGDVVNLKIRNKTTHGVIIDAQEIERSKTNLRRSSFILKKLPRTKVRKILSKPFLQASADSAYFFVGNIGQVVSQYTNKEFLEMEDNGNKLPTKTKKVSEQIFLMNPLEERLDEYKKIVRSAFAKNKSIFICLPNFSKINFVVEKLNLKNNSRVIPLHSNMPKKLLKENIKLATSSKKSVLVVATDSFLSIPRNDFGFYILENESTSTKKITRPYTETSFFIERLAYHSGSKIIFADHSPSLESYKKFNEGFLHNILPVKNNFLAGKKFSLTDMTKETENLNPKEKISIVSKELQEMVQKVISEKNKMILLVNRKGLATTTVCGDCSHVITCKTCDKPLSLVSEKGRKIFKCFKCQDKLSTKIYCEKCNSWNLRPLGIGVEKMTNEIKRIAPDAKLIIFSKDTIKSPSQIKKAIENFYSEDGCVLVGTEMMLNYLTDPVDYGAVGTLDNIFSLQDYRSHEKIFKLITTTMHFVRKKFILQTRHPEDPLINLVKKGLFSKFYENELSIRKKLKYPPFSTLIRVSFIGPKQVIVKDIENLLKITSKWFPQVISGYQKNGPKKYLGQIFFKIPKEKWPNDELRHILISLPTRYSIEVQPESPSG